MARETMMRQFSVERPLPGRCFAQMTVWLEDDPRLKVGTKLTLKEHPESWEITGRGEVPRRRSTLDPTHFRSLDAVEVPA